ncbi:hypothetical protein PCG10_002045 [Penicillium crustosum]|uniref:NmrA-like domain-containing protein n=1 Tax=Penicillium crustosum TaxID=36656 RepID=A0A9P5GFR7_PENCR|nr:uncharacterized protein N7487_010537 [Penicillium crustosum]KAF7516592.1 hypothetical protein PCG10_002045 [Penicillium crustosum]KAJ5396234.1 hypothetical protein N7487_010537 [Penicillium crustosum]
MSKELLTVFGLTGKQGSPVANYVLGDEELSQQYSVRGVTHSPSISKVRALKSKGALIIKADLDKLSRFFHALNGTYVLFFLTNAQAGAEGREIKYDRPMTCLMKH